MNVVAPGQNIDPATVAGFGEEWDSFDQVALAESEWHALFDRYFAIFPWDRLPENAEGFDLGCGSGRWAAGVSSPHGRDQQPRRIELRCLPPLCRTERCSGPHHGPRGCRQTRRNAADLIHPLRDGSPLSGKCEKARAIRPGPAFALH